MGRAVTPRAHAVLRKDIIACVSKHIAKIKAVQNARVDNQFSSLAETTSGV